jgi:hypothetical protein
MTKAQGYEQGNTEIKAPNSDPNLNFFTTPTGLAVTPVTKAGANTTTGSDKVDDVNINLDEESMSEGEQEELLNAEDEVDDEMAVDGS